MLLPSHRPKGNLWNHEPRWTFLLSWLSWLFCHSNGNLTTCSRFFSPTIYEAQGVTWNWKFHQDFGNRLWVQELAEPCFCTYSFITNASRWASRTGFISHSAYFSCHKKPRLICPPGLLPSPFHAAPYSLVCLLVYSLVCSHIFLPKLFRRASGIPDQQQRHMLTTT